MLAHCGRRCRDDDIERPDDPVEVGQRDDANSTRASPGKRFHRSASPRARTRWRARGACCAWHGGADAYAFQIRNYQYPRQREIRGDRYAGTKKSASDAPASSTIPGLDTFDHVVVLMLENRSLDNMLGFIYPDGVPSPAPAGSTFDGASLTMSNPVPPSAVNQPPDGSGKVFVTTTADYHQPYPDPGEEYYHINVQLWDLPNGGTKPPYNLPPAPLPTPEMQGFVTDYIEKLGEAVSKPSGPPTFAQYSQIMQCFDPAAVPVLSTLAQEFACSTTGIAPCRARPGATARSGTPRPRGAG
jgi:hypothetical protein